MVFFVNPDLDSSLSSRPLLNVIGCNSPAPANSENTSKTSFSSSLTQKQILISENKTKFFFLRIRFEKNIFKNGTSNALNRFTMYGRGRIERLVTSETSLSSEKSLRRRGKRCNRYSCWRRERGPSMVTGIVDDSRDDYIGD